jgi:hypothetical protein
MTLRILYAARGKLTMAQQIAESTGFKLFCNHVSIDVAKQFYGGV